MASYLLFSVIANDILEVFSMTMTILIIRSEAYAAQTEQLASELSDLVNTVHAPSYSDADEAYEHHQPALILAQDTIEEASAFDFCTRLRLVNNDDTTSLIIFTDQNNKMDRVRTFQVGADEYIAEFDIEYIKAVIERTLTHQQKTQKLSEEKEQASNLVMEAMKASSELGSTINFIERCQRFNSFDEIATELIQFSQSNGLSVVIAIADKDQWYYQSSSGEASKLEQDLMRSIHQQGRFVDFGLRTQMNWPNISILVKNMPLRDPEKYGRIKDLFPTLLSSANVRIHSMTEELRIKEQTSLMTRSIEQLQPSIEEVIQAMDKHSREHRNRLSDFLQKIVLTLPKLGLEDDQEDFFVSSVESLINQADEHAAKNKAQQETLHTTNRVLLNLLEKQLEIQQLIERPIEIADRPNDDDNELFELF